MGFGSSKCVCLESSPDPGADEKITNDPSVGGGKIFSFKALWRKKASNMSKVERSIKAALLIQRWYRRYCARLEVRRRYTWSIFQSIEYAGEQDQMKLHNFFNALLTHIGPVAGAAAELVEALSPRSSPTHGMGNLTDSIEEEARIEEIPIEYNYKGMHIKFPVTSEVVHELIDSFKKKKQLHAKYVCLILRKAARELRKRPTVTAASTAISHQITVIGDIHGKLDDLLTILYKNGLPSTENPYVFNGDFVDRGKKSIEVVVLLCVLLLAFPSEVFLNRGNHEDLVMNARYGFCKEVNRKYKAHGPRIVRHLEELYRWLPLATVIDQKVLVVHGGISDKTDIQKISAIDRGKYVSVLRMPSEKTQARNPYEGDEYEGPDSNVPESESDDEWKQILDLLWSDPQASCGCSPNVFRGGGTYFGPDVTKNILELHGYKLLIRSHECKIEGYEFMHDDQCLTIFSASNYYESGSNRGAYVKLQGPDLEHHLVQYMADAKQKQMTIRQRVGRMESSAIMELKTQILASKATILSGFKEMDPVNSGYISVSSWVKVMDERSGLTLPWRVLKDRIAVSDSSTGEVDYMTTFNEDTLTRKSPLKGGPTVVEALYRHKHSLETIFRLLDQDNSGFISMPEFEDACDMISRHMDTIIPKEEISDLGRSIDINKDGKIDFNEFLECFRIVDSGQAATPKAAPKYCNTEDDDDDDDEEDDEDYEDNWEITQI